MRCALTGEGCREETGPRAAGGRVGRGESSSFGRQMAGETGRWGSTGRSGGPGHGEWLRVWGLVLRGATAGF